MEQLENNRLESRGIPMKGPRWTTENDAHLATLCAENRSVADMAIILNRTEQAIFQRKHQLGLRTKDARTIALRTDLDALHIIRVGLENGRLYDDIARDLNASVNAVIDIARQHGWRRPPVSRPKRYGDDVVQRVRQLYEIEQLPAATVCRALSLTDQQLCYICQQHHIINAKTSRRWTAPDIEHLQQMLRDNCSVDDICRDLKRSDIAIVNRCEELGIQQQYPIIMERKNQLKNARCTFEKTLKWKLGFAKTRAAKLNIPFNLKVEDLLQMLDQQSGKCFYTEMELTPKPSVPNTISIDRVDSNQGYTKDNVVLCVWDVNRMKQDLPVNRFVDLCATIASRWKCR